MQVFEFHFNPKSKSDLIFDSFCYESENVYEKRLGSLYMVGSLKNVLPQNVRFLDNLAKTIKEKYYKTISATPEKSLKDALKKTNEFLENIAKRGDVSWLGNLNFAVIALKNFELNFTKVGDLKTFLLRKGQIVDIDQKLKFDEIEPYPLKIFGNIVSGKLAENDIILVLTKEISTIFLQENLLEGIANVSPFEPKRLREVLNSKKEQLTKIPGICLLITLSKEVATKEREMLTPKKVFALRQVFTPLVKLFKLPKISLKKPVLKIPQVRLKLPELKLPKPKIKIQAFPLNNKIILVLVLILFLVLGFFIFEKSEEKQLKTYREQLSQIEEKVSQAETYLILAEKNPQAKKNADSLFRESWQELSPLVKITSSFPSDFANQVLTLKNNISENLEQLSNLKIIEEPELIFEFESSGFIPQKLIFLKNNLYFFSPYSENVFEVNKKGEGKILSVSKKFNLGTAFLDSIMFFSKPNQLVNFKAGYFQEPFSLDPPYSDFNFNDFSSFQSNLYFLDKKSGTIIKYPYLGGNQWGSSQSWLGNKKATDAKSMAVDGSVWILNKNNSVEKYYAGSLQRTLELEIFPYPQNFSKIFTSSQLIYLYLLEPAQKRIVILNKSGQVVKQFQSEKFDNLLDFSVSEDGKTIFLLNGLKVYKILL